MHVPGGMDYTRVHLRPGVFWGDHQCKKNQVGTKNIPPFQLWRDIGDCIRQGSPAYLRRTEIIQIFPTCQGCQFQPTTSAHLLQIIGQLSHNIQPLSKKGKKWNISVNLVMEMKVKLVLKMKVKLVLKMKVKVEEIWSGKDTVKGYIVHLSRLNRASSLSTRQLPQDF